MKTRNILINFALASASAFFAVGIVFMWQYNNNGLPQPTAEERAKYNVGNEKKLREEVKLDKINQIFDKPLPSLKIPFYVPKSPKPMVILFLRVGCHWCEISMPSYRDLAKMDDIKYGRVVLTAVMPDKFEVAKKYLLDNRLPVYRLAAEQDFSSIGVSGTPTVMMLRDGKLKTAYLGPQKSGDMIEAVKQLVK